MSEYNAKNYTEQGGEKTVIGGEIDVTGTLKFNGTAFAPSANQAVSTAEDLATLLTDFNALLTKLKTAGMMAADS